jgi:glyoxylase-like metal-dependent hydrolase (beta-lactamase superfamily II)
MLFHSMWECAEIETQGKKENSMTDCITAFEYEGGIIALDAGMVGPLVACCYLLETDDALALIEVGTNSSVERILKVIESRGRSPDEVSHVIVTHVHLDHAGGAGSLMARLPNARFVVHPRGARHMIDPSRLEASARGVYGDEAFDSMYGTLIPIAAERIIEMGDGDSLHVGGRRLSFMDTPGHARHHFCVWDALTAGWFTGDTFGLSYRELDTDNGAFIFPTTTPTQFDPEALFASIDRLLEHSPRYMYLTHFGRIRDVAVVASRLKTAVSQFVSIAKTHENDDNRTDAIEAGIMDWLLDATRQHGVTLPEQKIREIVEYDVIFDTQGIEYWLDQMSVK